ncbi:MAG: hypothetical protein ACREM1_06220, partial [Longimicrobiales bacterium]
MASRPPRRPVDFVGEPGPGVEIDLYLPQPGQHAGRRIIKIEDIPEEYFRDTAVTTGVPWPDYFGVEKQANVWDIAKPEVFTGSWLDRYSRVRRVRSSQLGPLKASLNASARAALVAQGSLVSWARGSASVAARVSTAPDEAGNT